MGRIVKRSADEMRDARAKYLGKHNQRRKRKREELQPTLAVVDLETDPFRGPGYPIQPFVAGFYDGSTYLEFWGDDCILQFVSHLKTLSHPHVIYAHNGGKFDFMFMLDHIQGDVFCIGPRIVKAKIATEFEVGDKPVVHELRDSFAIVPVALKKAGEKFDFDYDKMLKDRRDRYRKEIGEYLKQDCVELYKVVETYRQTFGNALTMAGAAMRKLDEAMAPFLGRGKAAVRMTEREDEFYRQWYLGGRVTAFEHGIIVPRNGTLKIHDINSSYPHVMSTIAHPIGTAFRVSRELDADTDFAIVDATSQRCLPRKDSDTGKLDFPLGRFVFYATGHEIRTGLELGLLKVHRVLEARTCSERVTFEAFISTYWEARQIAKRNGQDIFDLFWKLVMNGAYGKFAQNPREFKDTMLVRAWEDEPDPAEGWVLKEYNLETRLQTFVRKCGDAPGGDRKLWRSFLNVATGASITGAARASLMRGLAAAVRPVYCDTDSVMCEDMPGVKDSRELGGWKLEHTGDYAAICARKLYGFFGPRSDDPKVEAERIRRYLDPYCIKIASKGVRLTAAQILEVAGRDGGEGGVVTYQSLAPTFRKDGSQWWQERRVRMV